MNDLNDGLRPSICGGVNMIKFSTLFFVGCCVALVGCSANKVLSPTGGSKADGTVEMSYELGAFEQPVVNQAAAQESAKARCQAWGYDTAEPFGGEVRKCQSSTSSGMCVQYFVTVTYQCTGEKKI
jgi:hypothetical protein